jgi:hypothetical protein
MRWGIDFGHYKALPGKPDIVLIDQKKPFSASLFIPYGLCW